MLAVAAAGGAFWWWSKRPKAISAPTTKGNVINDALIEANLMVKSLSNPGIRNNNPLNMRPNANSRRDPWVGQIGEKGGYLVFSDPVYGFRAAARNLRTYAKNGVNTIAAIVNRWAPKEDGNDPVAYAKFVSDRTGILSFTPVSESQYPQILLAMSKMETGKDYPMELAVKGVSLMDVQSPAGKSWPRDGKMPV